MGVCWNCLSRENEIASILDSSFSVKLFQDELLNGLHVAVRWMRKLCLLFSFPEEDNIESPVVQHVQLNLHDGKHSNALYFLSMFDPLQCSQSEVCSEHRLIRKCLS